jgi:hypothetical protein
MPAKQADRDDSALNCRDDVVEMLIREYDLGIELRVLDRHPSLVGERHQQIEVLGIKGIAGPLGADDDRADDRVLGHEREDQRPVEIS